MLVSPGAGDVVNLQRFYSGETVPCMELSLDCDWRTSLKRTLLIAVLLLAAANGEASTKLESWKIPNYSGQPSKQSSPYALDKMLDLKPGASKEDVEQAMQGHILAGAELTGTYRR
jgi:hypothetical protein